MASYTAFEIAFALDGASRREHTISTIHHDVMKRECHQDQSPGRPPLCLDEDSVHPDFGESCEDL